MKTAAPLLLLLFYYYYFPRRLGSFIIFENIDAPFLIEIYNLGLDLMCGQDIQTEKQNIV